MSSKYKIRDGSYAHFVTFTVVNWIDIFTRDEYRGIIIDSLKYCIQHKGLVVHGFVIMTNHIHLIISSKKDEILAGIVRDFKKYTSYKLLDALKTNQVESRKEWILWILKHAGAKNPCNEKYQFWQNGYHPVQLDTVLLLDQRLNYIHENPVRAGFVLSAEDYKYSSARNYSSMGDCVMKVELL